MDRCENNISKLLLKSAGIKILEQPKCMHMSKEIWITLNLLGTGRDNLCTSLSYAIKFYKNERVVKTQGTNIEKKCRHVYFKYASKLYLSYSPHDEHRSSGPRPVKLFSDQLIFFFKELYKNKFKNLMWTNKFKCSFQELLVHSS